MGAKKGKLACKPIEDVLAVMGGNKPKPRHLLTDLQLQIVKLAGDGLAYKNIAERLEIKTFDVGNERKRILKKLGAESMTQAVAICIRRGWI